jgi:predicted ester cyclase
MELKKCNLVLLSMATGIIFIIYFLFLSPISIEAQQTNDSSGANSSDTEEQEQSLQEEDSSQGEENYKVIIIAFTNASNDRNYTAIEQYVAEDIIEHRPGVMSGGNSTIQFLQNLATAFPNFHTNIDHIVAEGDKVIVFTTTSGTHQGEFIFTPGVPPSGKQVSFKTADMYRISNRQMVEHWDVIEILDLMAQIGAVTFNPPVPTVPNSPPDIATMAPAPNNVTGNNVPN